MMQLTNQPNAGTRPKPEETPLRNVYTNGLPELFTQLNISLVVSTYRAGKVILVRHDPGVASNGHGPIGTQNTHFRTFDKPMGMAVQGNKLAIGGKKTVCDTGHLAGGLVE